MRLARWRWDESVSILVLMEVLREVLMQIRTKLTGCGFNPCFNGSVERGRPQVDDRRDRCEFQSLF